MNQLKATLKRRRRSGALALCLSLFGRSLTGVPTGIVLTSAAVAATGCKATPKTPETSWQDLRKQAAASEEPDAVVDWLMAELLRPGGAAKSARQARARVDELKAKGVVADLTRAIDDLGQGRTKLASEEFFAALVAAQTWDDPRAPLFAWFAATRVEQLSGLSDDFGARTRIHIQALLKDPGHIGFRAYATIVELWASDAFTEAEAGVDDKMAAKLGCVENLSIAGPFGTESTSDILHSFPAEDPGVWPQAFPAQSGQSGFPEQLETERSGCDVLATKATGGGVYYGQTFLELEKPLEVIVSASGSTHIWVNDHLALHRDVRRWGIWPKFGVRLRLPPGRHRILVKINDPSTAIRVMDLNGTAANVRTSKDASLGYSLIAPSVGPDPNELMKFIQPTGVKDPGDDLSRFISAYMAHQEGQADVAALLFEPFVEKAELATGIALASAAAYVEDDPIYDKAQTDSLVHELELQAAERNPGLWYPRFRNIVWEARQKGPTTAISAIEKLAVEFPEVAPIRFTLAQLYESLGWGPEHASTVVALAAEFPDDEEAIGLAIQHYESSGEPKKVDQLLAHLMELNPDSEVFVERALNRKSYEEALAELRRLKTRRPSRKDIGARIAAILVDAGDKERAFSDLKRAVKREPLDVHARLALADGKLARGAANPLPAALVETVEAGADPSAIEGAIDLMEGLTALEPYRLSGLEIISAYEKRNVHLSGTAARVLDYGAVWVQSDGSSRFLEHEIVRIQSDEAIKRFTETQMGGLILHLRVIKKDGTIKEPEAVSGKPTVTMPHLEIGDYLETERIISRWSEGSGDTYEGPGWFFREQDVAYARSEFVIIAPTERALVLESHNGVPEPTIEKRGSVVAYRYRVDESPASPAEPNSPPEQEFLPRIAVGWGMDFDKRLLDLSRGMTTLTANDPRIVRIASKIIAKSKTEDQKLRALYHWVVDSVQEGEEADGRRVVVSRNGNRWRGFQTLCQAVGIPLSWAFAESRLSAPPGGPIASAARPLFPVLVVGRAPVWLTIDDKFAPFGTVPSHLRGEAAYLLTGEAPKSATVPTLGVEDAIRYAGKGKLAKDGSLKLNLRIIFEGAFATSLRNGLSQIPENQLSNIIESKLLAQYLEGARLKSYKVEDENDLDKPLVISVETEVPQFATASGLGLLIAPPFMPRLTGYTPLARRATPLLIEQESTQSVDLTILLPSGVNASVSQTKGNCAVSSYVVEDTTSPGSFRFKREVKTRAGRVPVNEYESFQKYANQADADLYQVVRLTR